MTWFLTIVLNYEPLSFLDDGCWFSFSTFLGFLFSWQLELFIQGAVLNFWKEISNKFKVAYVNSVSLVVITTSTSPFQSKEYISTAWFILVVFKDNETSISNFFGRHNSRNVLKLLFLDSQTVVFWLSKFYFLPKLLLGSVTTMSLSLRCFVALPKIV